MNSFDYLGWVPCLNGHLDFGLMRCALHGGFTSSAIDNNYLSINYSCGQYKDSHERQIVLQSYVDWQDTKQHESKNGCFRVVVSARVKASENMDERALSGHILIYPRDAEPTSRAQREQMKLHTLCHAIDSSSDIGVRTGDFNHLEKLISLMEPIEEIDGFCSSIEFRIEPNGLTTFKYNPNSAVLNDRQRFVIARQAFYYLKYSLHTHKHHTTKQDSLISIMPVGQGEGVDLKNAGLKLICQLKRELTCLKRTQGNDLKPHPTNNAAGIIAYSRSLIITLAEKDWLDDSVKERELARFEQLQQSFIAQNNKAENLYGNKELYRSKAKVWLGLMMVSCWALINFIFKYEDQSHKISVDMIEVGSGVIILTAAVSLIYRVAILFYEHREKPEAVEHLYHQSYRHYLTKVIRSLIAAIVIVVLFFFIP